MITRRKLLMGVCICIPFAAVRVRAGEPSAKSFVEAIYANYIGKDSKGFFLETDAAVRRYFDPKLAASSSRTARKRAARSASLTLIPSSTPRIGGSTESMSRSVRSGPTKRARPSHSKVWATRRALSSIWSGSGWVGESPISLGIASTAWERIRYAEF